MRNACYQNKARLLIVILLVLIFQDFISSYIPLFKYFDEIFSLSAFLILIIEVLSNHGKIRLKRDEKNLFVFWGGFILCGCISYWMNSSQPVIAFAGDLFLNSKFVLAFYVGNKIGKSSSKFNKQIIANSITIITALLFFALICNFFFRFFPTQEIRFGIPIQKLFFSHSGYLASCAILLFVITLYLYETITMPFVYIFMQLFIVVSTLRYKAIACAMVFLLIYYVKILRKSSFKWYHWLIFIFAFGLFGWDQIALYYGAGALNNARGALTINSIRIARNLFPFGAGFGTYGSYMTRIYYSSYYYKYGLSGIWGLTPNSQNFSFFSDTFWPMILGQTGYLGLICYLFMLVCFVKQINKLKVVSKTAYISCFCVLIYLFIESTSSSAFVSPQAIPFAVWIGAIKANTGSSEYYKN